MSTLYHEIIAKAVRPIAREHKGSYSRDKDQLTEFHEGACRLAPQPHFAEHLRKRISDYRISLRERAKVLYLGPYYAILIVIAAAVQSTLALSFYYNLRTLWQCRKPRLLIWCNQLTKIL